MTINRFIPVVQLKRHFLSIIVTLFVFFSFLIIVHQQHSAPHEYALSTLTNEFRYEGYCRQIGQRINVEQISHVSTQLNPGNGSIPYSYSQWRSISLMPRLLTQCEHAIYMHLLSILIEHVFKKYNIQYMMMAATLLGSYTRHDLLPWDDDMDLSVSISNRSNLQSIIRRELSSEPYSIRILQMFNARNYDKIFFSWCPHTSLYSWGFPFIDIFYHDQNSTHVWLLGKPSSCPVRRKDVFPLVFRPLGSLWLYGPREPMAHFESRKMMKIETGCFTSAYSHKYERLFRKYGFFADCSKLKSVYPYVERQCISQRCTEYLKLGNSSIIHTLIYNYAYRTFLYAETNKFYRAC